jgi:hypothetical protein
MVSPFRAKARLEAEIIFLRHQLNVLRRRVPSNPKLAGNCHSMASDGLPTVLAVGQS